MAAFPALHPQEERSSPLQAALLTDAELDHTLGLLLLREARRLELHATATVHDALCKATSLLPTLRAYCSVEWHPVVPEVEVSLDEGLSYCAFDVPTRKAPRFPSASLEGRVVGYRFTDASTGAALIYVPGVQQLTATLRAKFEDCSCLLFDGTCWDDDELHRLGINKTARDMGHLPINGPDGSLAQLAPLDIDRKVYIHINNTNPILLDDSSERRMVEEHGLEVAVDGLEVQI